MVAFNAVDTHTHRRAGLISTHLTSAHIFVSSQETQRFEYHSLVGNIINQCFKWIDIGDNIQISSFQKFASFEREGWRWRPWERHKVKCQNYIDEFILEMVGLVIIEGWWCEIICRSMQKLIF